MATGFAHLVVGGDGLIGSGVVDWLTARGERVYATTRRPEKVGPMHPFLDLKQDVDDWEPPEPVETVFICAGATRMQDCEERPDETARVNVVSPHIIASKLVARGAFIVGLSSNGRQEIVPGATHDMPFEKPDVIVKAIRDILDGAAG